MATKLNGAISLSKIPKDSIRSYTKQDGSVDKSIFIDVIPLKETDSNGNTHNVTMYVGGQTIYLGRLKPKEFGNTGNSPANDNSNPYLKPQSQNVATGDASFDDGGDLPF